MDATLSPSPAGCRRRHTSRGVALLAVLTMGLLALLGSVLTAAPGAHADEVDADEAPVLEYYGTESCPYCQAMQPFLDEIDGQYPGLEVARYDVADPANASRWEQEMAARGQQAQGVPTAILGDEVWVGFSDEIAADIETAVADTPGVDTPVADGSGDDSSGDGAAAAPAQTGGGGPSVLAMAIGAAVVALIAVALFAPRRSSSDTD